VKQARDSNGCFRARHGHAAKPTSIYMIWHEMIERCRNPNNKAYPNYGGRGITVCKRWLKFENFLTDMGEHPVGLSIDRINNNGNYEPSNCRWATRSEQMINSRNAKLVTWNGVTKTIKGWAQYLGTHGTMLSRSARINKIKVEDVVLSILKARPDGR